MPDQQPHTRITAEERVRRNIILRDIHTQIAKNGPHVARPHADRARQFMPFDALQGYDEMIAQAACDVQSIYDSPNSSKRLNKKKFTDE